MIDVIFLIALALLLVLFAWLTKRAWGSKRAILRWIGVILAGLVTLLFALLLAVASIGFAKLNLPQNPPVSNVQVAGTPDQIARGEKLAYICAGCHSTTAAPPLDGGTASFAGPLGSLYPPNLTPGGPLANWSDGEIIRAVREGVDKDGRPLFVMPSEYFHVMSDDDVQSLVAYVRSEKDVQREVPPKALNPLGMVLVGIGVFPSSVQKPITQPLYSPPMSAAVDHGKYLVEISGCHSCHGADLAGGTPGGFTPVGPNLTAIVNKWNEADFIKTIRTGVDPSGHAIAPDQMPWKNFSAAYDDSELGTIYAYLHSLPPIDRSVR